MSDAAAPDVRLIDLLVEAKTIGDRAVRRIAKDGIAAADQHWEIHNPELKAVQ